MNQAGKLTNLSFVREGAEGGFAYVDYNFTFTNSSAGMKYAATVGGWFYEFWESEDWLPANDHVVAVTLADTE